MRLEIGTFPVEDIEFGSETRWTAGRLEINPEELLKPVLDDPRIESARIEVAGPGESVRIWPVRDVIEPRIKVKGQGMVYPGMCDRPVATVGQGVTHRLSGVGVVEVSEVQQHEQGGDYTDLYIDMSGPWAELMPYASMLNVCVVVEPDPVLHVDIKNRAVHQACLTVSDTLAATVKHLTPPQRETFELGAVSPSLPRVVYIPCIHSPQAMSGSPSTFCISIYGISQLTSPWPMHPNEMLDGAISGPYRTGFATSWTMVNNPVLIEMYRRHGADFNLVACIALKTEWTMQHEKDLMAQQTAKMANQFGAQGALVTWDAGGNEFMEVIRTIQSCERLGIKTVFLTSEDLSTEGVSTMLEPIAEADAMVSTGFFPSKALELGELPPVERVIGSPEKVTGPLRDRLVPTAGSLKPPRRYDDHYGFNRLTCVET
jgi:glycine reductase